MLRSSSNAPATHSISLASQERRKFGRRASRITAAIAVAGKPMIPCAIIDHSEGGAFLEINGVADLPRLIRLVVTEHGYEIVAEVRHRSGQGVGIQFVRGDIAKFQATYAGMSALAPVKAEAKSPPPPPAPRIPQPRTPTVITLGPPPPSESVAG